MAGPGVTLAQAPTGREQTTGAFHLTSTQASLCTWGVTTELRAQLDDMAVGYPDQNASLVSTVKASYASDPTGFANVSRIVGELLATASPDYFDKYGRSVSAELVAYAPKIRTACTS